MGVQPRKDRITGNAAQWPCVVSQGRNAARRKECAEKLWHEIKQGFSYSPVIPETNMKIRDLGNTRDDQYGAGYPAAKLNQPDRAHKLKLICFGDAANRITTWMPGGKDEKAICPLWGRGPATRSSTCGASYYVRHYTPAGCRTADELLRISRIQVTMETPRILYGAPHLFKRFLRIYHVIYYSVSPPFRRDDNSRTEPSGGTGTATISHGDSGHLSKRVNIMSTTEIHGPKRHHIIYRHLMKSCAKYCRE